ncbi:MAG: hypothetical protein QNJ62_04945 [Methyloceanibacter sp.]|nr:hypothetical protein [Methyloceanibacter sp.]
MPAWKDMQWCASDCTNTACERNLRNVPEKGYPYLKQADMSPGCADYRRPAPPEGVE